MDDPEPDTEPYTPGRLASTSFSSTADAYLYPSYSSPPKPKPVFVPASVTVKVPPADEVFTKGTDAALAQSLGKASPRGGSPKGQARPEHQKSSSGGGALIFTQSEARSLQARVRGDRRQLHALKRLVAPDLKRVEGAFVELMTRVMVRGEAVGNADKALARSFEVFAGRAATSVSTTQFATKLSTLSMSWSSFAGDECLALALSLDLSGRGETVTLQDFKRFANSRCGPGAAAKGGASGLTSRADASEMDETYFDDEDDAEGEGGGGGGGNR
ncbi:hypothetical protein TeGR_g726, partial [Tetraparma gracilis]